MNDQIVPLTKKLISCASVAEDKKALRDVLEMCAKELSEFTVEWFENNGIPSLLAYVGEKRPENFHVILNAHVDVVPADTKQFTASENDGKLYGRGASDMKAAAACELLVFKELAKTLSYPLGLQLVTDEEIGGHNGTKYQIEQGVRADFVIAGEPTNFRIGNQAKGILWVRLTTQGISAHAAYPWNGKNAIVNMTQLLSKILQTYPIPESEAWKTTINISKIETSNTAMNKVPDSCSAYLDIRYIPEEKEQVLEDLNKLCEGNATLEITFNEPSHDGVENDPFVKSLKEVTDVETGIDNAITKRHGGSDLRHFSAVGCPGVEFGPIGDGLHTDNEWVNASSLSTYYSILKKFLQNRSS